MFASTALILSGCRVPVYISFTLPLSQMDARDHSLGATALVSVSSCVDEQGSASNGLLRLRRGLRELLPSHRYVGCTRRDEKNLAEISFDIPWNARPDGPLASAGGPFLFRQGPLTNFAVPEAISDKLRFEMNRGFVTQSFDDYHLEITLLNDLEWAVEFEVFSSFVDGKPVIVEPCTLQPGERTQVEFSEFLVQTILIEGAAPFLKQASE